MNFQYNNFYLLFIFYITTGLSINKFFYENKKERKNKKKDNPNLNEPP